MSGSVVTYVGRGVNSGEGVNSGGGRAVILGGLSQVKLSPQPKNLANTRFMFSIHSSLSQYNVEISIQNLIPCQIV